MDLLRIIKNWGYRPKSWWVLEEIVLVKKGYLNKSMSKFMLSNESQLSEDEIQLWSESIYNRSFESLLRQLRIDDLIELRTRYGDELSEECYAKLVGYDDATIMKKDFLEEVNIDYFEFFEQIKTQKK